MTKKEKAKIILRGFPLDGINEFKKRLLFCSNKKLLNIIDVRTAEIQENNDRLIKSNKILRSAITYMIEELNDTWMDENDRINLIEKLRDFGLES